MPQDYRLVFLTPIGCIIALIVGYSMGLPMGETIKWAIIFCGMWSLTYVFFAYPKGREDWNYSLGETLSMFGIVFIAIAIVILAFYICVKYENPDWRAISVWLVYIILTIMGIFSVFITLHGSGGLVSGGEGGDMFSSGSSGGQKESKWGVPDVEARYGKRLGWAGSGGSGVQQPKK